MTAKQTAVRPDASEFNPYFSRYVDLVPHGDIAETLARQAGETRRFLDSIDEEKSRHRYAEGKWSLREVVGHMTDAERVFAYRALAIGRGDQQSLPGFEETDYVVTSGADDVSLRDLASGFAAVRETTLLLVRTFPSSAWERIGTANGNRISTRALVHIIAGHELHHLGVIRARYL